LPVSVDLFYIRFEQHLFQVCSLQLYLLQTSLLQTHFLEVYLLAGRQAGKLRPLVAPLQHFAHLLEKLRMRIIAPPAPAIAKFDEALLPTSMRTSHLRAILSYGLCCRSDMKKAKVGVKSALWIRSARC
jgi:hypothetical protein